MAQTPRCPTVLPLALVFVLAPLGCYSSGDGGASAGSSAGTATDGGTPESGGGDEKGGAGSSGADGGAPVDPTFAHVYADVIKPHCVECHVAQHESKLNMATQPTAYANLVDTKAQGSACGASGHVRVVAGNPDASLLVAKVEGTMDCGARMPYRLPNLEPGLQALVRAWVAAGALDN